MTIGARFRGGAARGLAYLARRRARRRAARRRRFVEQAGRHTRYVAVQKGQALLFVPTFQKVGRDRFAKPEWKETRHLGRALATLEQLGLGRPRGTFVDVGAHIGTTTVAALVEHGFASGVAFEPEPGNFLLLRVNLIANGLEERVRPLNVAVSNYTGHATLRLRPEIGSKHHIVTAGETEADLRVPVRTLDACVEDGILDPKTAGLLWIDVEGHELAVLEGARTLLGTSVPIVMEFTPRQLTRDRVDAIAALLTGPYSDIVDLRRAFGDRPACRPIAALHDIADGYPHPFTDLLVVSRPE